VDTGNVEQQMDLASPAGRRDQSLGCREEGLMKQNCKSCLLYSWVRELWPWSYAVGFSI